MGRIAEKSRSGKAGNRAMDQPRANSVCFTGHRVFASPEALQKQESIIHPEVSRLLEEFIAAHPEQTCVLNATVLNKVPLAAKCDFIIYVDAPFIVRLIRAKKRDHHSVFHLLKRFSSQKKLYAQYQKLNVDIYRVRNIGSSSKLHKKLQRIFESRCFK